MSPLSSYFAALATAHGLQLPRAGHSLALPGSGELRRSQSYSHVLASGAARRARAQQLATRRDAHVGGKRIDASPATCKDYPVHAQAMDLARIEEWARFLDDGNGRGGASRLDGAGHFDAAGRMDALVPMASQALTYFYSEVYQIEHADLPAWNGDILAIDRTVDPAAERYQWYEMDILGVARASNSYSAEDVPMVAGPAASPNLGNIVPALVGMEVNFMDARRQSLANRNGKPDFDIERMKAEACQRSLAEFGHYLWLYGDATLGIDGLHNHPAVSTITLAGGPWSGKTPQQILSDLTTMLFTIPNTTLQGLKDMKKIKIFLPPPQWQQANTMPITASGDESVLSYFKKINSLRDDQVLPLAELQASFSQVYTGGPQFLSADRGLVIYRENDVRKDPVFVLPQDIEMPAPPRNNGLSETTFYHARFGGMKVPDARRIRYVAGL